MSTGLTSEKGVRFKTLTISQGDEKTIVRPCPTPLDQCLQPPEQIFQGVGYNQVHLNNQHLAQLEYNYEQLSGVKDIRGQLTFVPVQLKSEE